MQGDEISDGPEEKINRQIFGCTEAKICFSSGLLSMIKNENEKQTSEFLNFIEGISIT